MTPRVLVVDDEADFLQLMEFNLSQMGFEVLGAADGMECLRKARAELPDVVLLDLMLPDLDGFSVCEILQAQPSTRDIPVIILTALKSDATRVRSSQIKVARFFTKGVDLRSLGKCVREVCNENSRRVQVRVAQEDHPAGKVAALD
jgi:DNA-binding response OmpR family regulator